MTYLPKIRWWLLALLIAFAPFHAFLITWAGSLFAKVPALTGILAVWREVVVLLIGVIVAIEFFEKKTGGKKWNPLNWDKLDFLIVLYALLAFVWLPFQGAPFSQWLIGFRYDLVPLLFFMIIRHSNWESKSRLIIIALASAAIVILFGLAHALLLPQDFLTHFGYSTSQGEYQAGSAISACQYLEHTDAVCRATSTFGGPTRYGTYLLLVLGLLLPFLLEKTRFRKYAIALFALALASVVITYSRSIWVGLLAATIFTVFWVTPKKIVFKAILALLIFIGLWFFYSKLGTMWNFKGAEFPPPFIKTIFVRTGSSDEHMKLLKDGLAIVVQNPLGIGLGKAGPASVRFDKFLTENWFLQIAVEMGVLGLAIFLGILAAFAKKLLAKKKDLVKLGLFLAFLGIAVAGLFTHSFEETSAVLILMAVMGLRY